jgi:hypothetical protein
MVTTIISRLSICIRVALLIGISLVVAWPPFVIAVGIIALIQATAALSAPARVSIRSGAA